ncbi:mandelate racemase [Actinomyces faecalis]|uniref:mandelate racemase n=1 Tax=Actinomyces faecalis TaxID=2722820 RepID=UPI00155327CE|nr:mandelate racemase [Actinomyces faecalis]
MIAPVIDQVVVTTPESTTSSEAEAKAADLLTFKIGMAVVAAVIAVMAVVGAVIASAPLLIASGVTGSIAAFVGVYTGINLMTA